MGNQNRPFKYGPNDRREFIVQDSEVAFRAENNGDGNPIYVGRAKIGTLDADDKWQICFIEYDGVLEELKNKNPRNENGNRHFCHHQFLTPLIGDDNLKKQIVQTITVMKLSKSIIAKLRV